MAEKRGKPLPRKGTIARFLRRSATSLSKASALVGSAGTGVTWNGAGGGAVTPDDTPPPPLTGSTDPGNPARHVGKSPKPPPPLRGPTQGGMDSACSHLRKGLPLPRPLPNLAGGAVTGPGRTAWIRALRPATPNPPDVTPLRRMETSPACGRFVSLTVGGHGFGIRRFAKSLSPCHVLFYHMIESTAKQVRPQQGVAINSPAAMHDRPNKGNALRRRK